MTKRLTGPATTERGYDRRKRAYLVDFATLPTDEQARHLAYALHYVVTKCVDVAGDEQTSADLSKGTINADYELGGAA